MPITYKIRITSDSEEEAELLREAFRAVFGRKLTLSKARKGNNPKYASDPKFLAYGELEFDRAELQEAAGVMPAPAKPAKKRSPAKKAAAPKRAAVASLATGETIALPPAPRRRTKKP